MGNLVWELGLSPVGHSQPLSVSVWQGVWPELFQMVHSGVGCAEHGHEGSTGRDREACLEAAALIHTKNGKA